MTTCRLCQGTKLTLRLVQDRYSVLQCNHCNFIQVKERRLSRAEEPAYNMRNSIYQKSYFDTVKYDDQKILQRENKRRIGVIKKFLFGRQINILDAGCGIGDFIEEAKQEFSMWGFDISPFAIDVAKKNNPELAERIWRGDLEEQISQNNFDAVCLWDVIEHLWDPVLITKLVISYLKPGGYLFISTPAIDRIVPKLMGKHWAFMTPPEHLSFFTSHSFQYLFQQLTVMEIVYDRCWGKWTNIGFILYKLGRISHFQFTSQSNQSFIKRMISKIAIYVPTHDIRYIVARKPV